MRPVNTGAESLESDVGLQVVEKVWVGLLAGVTFLARLHRSQCYPGCCRVLSMSYLVSMSIMTASVPSWIKE